AAQIRLPSSPYVHPGRNRSLLPTCPYFPIDLVNLYRYPSPLNHVLLRTTGMAGSCASSIMGAATTAVQIWYDTDLLGNETHFNDCVQEQALHRSAMKTLPLLHNLRVCPEQGSFLFAVY